MAKEYRSAYRLISAINIAGWVMVVLGCGLGVIWFVSLLNSVGSFASQLAVLVGSVSLIVSGMVIFAMNQFTEATVDTARNTERMLEILSTNIFSTGVQAANISAGNASISSLPLSSGPMMSFDEKMNRLAGGGVFEQPSEKGGHSGVGEKAGGDAEGYDIEPAKSLQLQIESYRFSLSSDGRDRRHNRRVKDIHPYDGSWKNWVGGIRVEFDDGAVLLRHGSADRLFPVGDDSWK